MVQVDVIAGSVVLLVGAGFFVIELFHPGALLLIPATIMIVGGVMYLLTPDILLDSIYGPIAIALAAVLATGITILYYRWLAGTHQPLSTTSGSLVGQEAVVITDVVPNTLRGKVRVRSEVWSAKATAPIPAGTKVRVVAGEGVSVTVEPVPVEVPP
jgi:membrane protein implicated in regulation of membrane protease activity